MSEDKLNESILAGWESAGLDANSDEGMEVPDVSGEVIVDDPDPAPDADAVDEPLDAADASDDLPPVEEPVNDETPADTTGEVAKTPAEEKQQELEDDLAAALGLGKPPDDPKKKAQWWKSRIPYSQVKKIVTDREKKLRETHDGVVKEHSGKVTEFETRFKDVAKVEDFIKTQHVEYAKTLANMFPETYGKLFAPILGQHDGKAAPVVPAVEDLGEMPGPNLKLSDGSMTYDLDGLKARDEWVVKKTKQDVLQAFKPQMDFLEKQKSQAQKDEETRQAAKLAQDREEQGKQAAAAAVEDLKTWDFVTDKNIDEILKEAGKLDPSYNVDRALSIAYRKVIGPQIKADRDKMKAEWLKEQKAASAKKTAITIAAGQTQRKAEVPAEASLDDRIRAAAKRKGIDI